MSNNSLKFTVGFLVLIMWDGQQSYEYSYMVMFSIRLFGVKIVFILFWN